MRPQKTVTAQTLELFQQYKEIMMPGMKMVKGKDGKMVPSFAMDGKGANDMAKMKKGGSAKKAAAKKAAAKKAMKKKKATGAKKKMYGGPAKKPKGMMYGGKPVYKSRMS